MPKLNDDNWDKKYSGLYKTRRFLVSFPVEMLDDIELLAKEQQVSQAELIRRAVAGFITTSELTD